MINFSTFLRHRGAKATGLIFAATGLLFGTWAALIPYIKQKFALDEAQLGLLLLALPAGVTLMNPVSVPLLRRYGAVLLSLWALPLAAWLFIFPFMMPEIWLAAGCLFLAGMAFSATNMGMNTCASMLEQRAGLRIMSTCHGLWSAGAMSGSALAGTITGWGMLPARYLLVLAILLTASILALRNLLREVPEDARHDDHSSGTPEERPAGFIMPNSALWTLIVISLCTNLTEGTMADWSAVYMREVVGSAEALAGWGFATYAFFMAGGRFIGDELIGRYGPRRVLRMGGCIAALGLLISIVFPTVSGALTGFALVGAGVSLGAPILYASAALAPGMAKGAGLATMNTFAMIGFLGGPAFIGFFAKAFSLPAAFGLVAGVAGVWVWRAGRVG